jgi:hypothetical protein
MCWVRTAQKIAYFCIFTSSWPAQKKQIRFEAKEYARSQTYSSIELEEAFQRAWRKKLENKKIKRHFNI